MQMEVIFKSVMRFPDTHRCLEGNELAVDFIFPSELKKERKTCGLLFGMFYIQYDIVT